MSPLREATSKQPWCEYTVEDCCSFSLLSCPLGPCISRMQHVCYVALFERRVASRQAVHFFASQASRILANLLIAGGAMVFRAATQAYRQALVSA